MAVTFVPVSIPDATTYTVLADNSGIRHYVPDFSSTCTATLPAPKAGLWFEFVYAGLAADAQNFVISTGSDTNYYVGAITFIDHDTDVVSPLAPDGNSNSKLTLVTPAGGTIIRIESTNGTTWTVSGFAASATVPAFADQ